MNNKNGVIVIWWIILMIALLIAFGFWLGEKADAKLSDDTLEIVDNLRIKHYGLSTFFYITDDTLFYRIDQRPEEYKWTSITFEDGILYIETQDGKWFIGMEKVEDNEDDN